jgi:hypothetical protein
MTDNDNHKNEENRHEDRQQRNTDDNKKGDWRGREQTAFAKHKRPHTQQPRQQGCDTDTIMV